MISGKILKLYGWPEGKIIGLAKAASEQLVASGLRQDAVLVWLEQVRTDPARFLADPYLAALARECLRRAASEGELTGTFTSRLVRLTGEVGEV